MLYILEILLAAYCLRGAFYIILAIRKRRRDKKISLQRGLFLPKTVDIILPMYNEESVIVQTITNLLAIDYPLFSVIVVDDGSTDNSYSEAVRNFGDHPKVRIIHQPNAGKSTALNNALHASDSDFIICIDADTLVKPDVVHNLLPHFDDQKVGAVSGYVNVGNRVNWLTKMQHMEYRTIQNYDRIMFESVNGVLVVPGALGAFRRSVVVELGGFVSEALAEDCDITLRMLCKGYVIRNAADAASFTEAPTTAKMFIKQRVRWTVGLVQGLIKHGKSLSSQPNRWLAYVVLPFTWIFRVVLPFVVPVVDYVFLFGYFLFGNSRLLILYLLCIAMELIPTIYILARRGEIVNPLKVILLQRYFRHMMCITYLCIFFKWINGNLYGWGKIPRQGNVKVD